MPTSDDLLVCVACGTQFDVPARKPLANCRICDDPRQYVPPTGQAWTSLGERKGKHENRWQQDDEDERIWSIWTEPKLGIGQRAILLMTPHGNVLWDCIAYLDDATVEFVNSKGGLKAIVISHPHFYTTHVDWATTFDCPVYVAAEDQEWLSRPAPGDKRVLLDSPQTELIPGVTAVKVGGHFSGSMVLHWDKKLFTADSIMIVPSALYFKNRMPGTTSFSFMWSYPNMIPLPPREIFNIWKAVKPFEFESTHGGFLGQTVRDRNVKARLLESMKIQSKNETGHEDHPIMREAWP